MVDNRTRRRFLQVGSVACLTSVAGCKHKSSGRRTESTFNTNYSSTSSSTEGSQSPTDSILPSLFNVNVAGWPGDSIVSKVLNISGIATDNRGVSEVIIELETGQSRRVEGSGQSSLDFEIDIPISGGRSYTGQITVQDTTSNQIRAEFESGYIPKPKRPPDHDRIIGTPYYVWWGNGRHWHKGYRGTPVLGEYNSRNTNIINQHIQWARQYGINTFVVRWDRPGGWDDTTLRNHFRNANLSNQIQYTIQPSTGYWVSDKGISFDDQRNRRQLRQLYTYLEDHYFNEDNYLHLDGRPTIYFYAANQFTGDIEGAFAEAAQLIDADPYVISDFQMLYAPMAIPRRVDTVSSLVEVSDAVTEFSGAYYRVEDINQDFIEKAKDRYLDWCLLAEHADVDFIPTVKPSYDKSEWDPPNQDEGEPPPILERKPDRFRRFCNAMLEYLEPGIDAVVVNSFNEWHEYDQIEPSEEYGKTYLDIVSATLGTKPIDQYIRNQNYMKLELDFNKTVSPGNRPIAFSLGRITLRNGATTLAEYDIGVPENEPSFVEGVYIPEQNEDSEIKTWRWLGGPSGRAIIYFPPDTAGATEIVLFGSSVESGIAADVYVNGTMTDTIQFSKRLAEYRVSAEP